MKTLRNISKFHADDLTNRTHFIFMKGLEVGGHYTRSLTETNSELYDNLCDAVFDLANEYRTSYLHIHVLDASGILPNSKI